MDDYRDDIAAIARIDIVPTILATVCRATGMGFAAIARVTDERWIACSVRDEINFGLEPGGELKLETTICHEIRQTGEPVVISDVLTDPLYHDHHTPSLYGLRSYISMPIILPDGRFFGTLCAIDPNPRDLGNPDTRAMFEMFAQIVGSQLDQADRLADAEARITVQQQDAELREQFIAVVGHDLRNPIANVQAGVTLLDRGQPRERSQLILQNMQSSVDRMVNMIENILDFARGRLGGGLTLQKRPVEIGPVLEQVIDELRHSNADRVITHEFSASIVLDCDPMRIAQLLSNLVGNAVTHGASDQLITIRCSAFDECFTLAVSNGGAPIPEAARALLFHPFARGKVSNDREGLGLGLYIASQIAAAHGGNLSVTSDAGETCFAFRMPLKNTVVQSEPALA